MRLYIEPFKHSQYSALRERSEPLAFIWAIGHLVFAISLMMAVVLSLGVAMIALIDLDVPRERVWSAIEASVAGTLFFASIGFAVKRYAVKKGSV